MSKYACLMMVAVVAAASVASAATIMVDLGPDDLGKGLANGNGVTVNTGLLPVENLLDTGGNATTVDITHAGFKTNTSNIGTSTFTGDAAIFSGVANSLYLDYANAGTVTLYDLSAIATYDLVLFSAKTGVSDARDAVFAIQAGNGGTILSLDAANNTTEVVSATGLTADANGEITITVTKGPNSSRYFYFSAMQITENANIPEPASMGLLALGGMTAFVRRRR